MPFKQLDQTLSSETGERVHPHEVIIATGKTEQIFNESGVGKNPRERLLYCGLGAEICRHFLLYSEKDIPNEDLEGEPLIVMVWRLHAAARGLDQNELQDNLMNTGTRPEGQMGVFHHTFCLYKIEDTAYILDPTFSQFVNPKTLKVDEGLDDCKPRDFVTNISTELPTVKQLLEFGFIELTEENARIFLMATCDINSQDQIPQNIDVRNMLLNIVPEESDYTKEEMDAICFLGNKI